MKNFIKIFIFIIFLLITNNLFANTIVFLNFNVVNMLISISLVFFAFIIFLENRSPSQTVAWFVIFASIPLLGFIFYLLLGRNFRKEYKFRNKYKEDKYAIQNSDEYFHSSIENSTIKLNKNNQKVINLATNIGQNPISFATDTTLLTDGEHKFSEIKQVLKDAKYHIHLEYYIFRNDTIGKQILNILIEKAEQGVEVRILLDAVGSWKLSKRQVSKLIEQGLQITFFNSVRIPILNSKINFRNHRKIIIVDGKIGFIGGMNIGDEYLGKNKYFGFWRDTHLKVEGESVISLQNIFLQDWCYMNKGTPMTLEKYLQPSYEIKKQYSGGVHIVSGGPDNRFSVLKDLFFSMITSAKKSIWIASPYFIPDEDIFSALKIAARSKIEVKLLLPSKPDKKIVFYASRSYLPDLMAAGVKVYEYQKGFTHSKIIIVDNNIASIGTANMDMRSFHLNFEVNAFLYETDSIKDLVKNFNIDLSNSEEICQEKFSQRSVFLKIFESLTRLLSPFL